ncbi:MAG: hypothetical protein LBS62_07955 [Clostridiales bacterium]|jgi:hypothetical protein|nr:hypothetical protein [Clostridiales bacterium]
MNVRRHFAAVNLVIFVLLLGLLLFGNIDSFTVSYVVIFILVSLRTMVTPDSENIKKYLIAAYCAIMVLQIYTCAGVVFDEAYRQGVGGGVEHFFRKIFGIALILLPLTISRYICVGKYAKFYLPSVSEAAAISFSELKAGLCAVGGALDTLNQAGRNLSSGNIKAIIDDLPRHDSFRYINNASLTPEYFAEASQSLTDSRIYIVISNTGSAAGEVISVFTRKQYNHASLSFDKDLRTIVSYNGGERVYPPGLNKEMIEFFRKKPGASILVYSLPCSKEQKAAILAKIEEINQEGSAYNMAGLVLKHSYKPNIMFCSQFVYKMLDWAGISYFTKPDGSVCPTDLIELDYYKKLSFEYELRLN